MIGDQLSPPLEELIRLVQEGNRDGVKRHIQRNREHLLGIVLIDPAVCIEQAHKDFQRERVLLNSVPFIPSKTHTYKNHTFVGTVARLVERLSRMSSVFDRDSSDLVLRRACRTGAGADGVFLVQRLFCVEGTFAKHCSDQSDPPIKLEIYLEDTNGIPQLCSRSYVCNNFAIHDIDHIEQLTGHEGSDPPPWLWVESIVTDFSNLATGEHSRKVDFVVSVPYGLREFRPL